MCSAWPGAASAGAAGTSAELVSARGEMIGTVGGRSSGFDGNAAIIGAYGVVSTRGYFADVLPSGALGQVMSLVFASADCSGAPAIEQSSVAGGPLPVPAYVFAFGAPAQVFNVPADAGLRDMEVGSERQRSARRLHLCRCHARAGLPPGSPDRADVSGFADHYAGPLRVQMKNIATVTSDAPSATGTRSRTQSGRRRKRCRCRPARQHAGMCAGLLDAYLGDHICESACANSLCGFDAGDCSVAYVERAQKKRSRTVCTDM